MNKLAAVLILTIFSFFVSPCHAGVSPLRLSIMGGMFSGKGFFYGTLPYNISTVYGIDFGIIGAKIDTAYGLQTSLVCVSNVTAGAQIAPVLSISENVVGAQLSGIISHSKRGLTGLQAAGMAAVAVDGDMNGIQLAGWGCVNNMSFNGLQSALAIVYAEEMRGIQAAGVYAKINKEMNGLQLSFLAAYAEHINGIQLAGFAGGGSVNGLSVISIRLNSYQQRESNGLVLSAVSLGKSISGNDFYAVSGVQISGINLFTGKVRGVQIGVINITEKVKGVQIGVINYARELKGVQIGLINIAENALMPMLPVADFKF